MLLVNQPGLESWPITGATNILIYKEQDKNDEARELLRFLDWCYKYGDNMAIDLNYVPIPDNVVRMVQELWSKEVEYQGQKLWK